jgi:proline dehydrogenase
MAKSKSLILNPDKNPILGVLTRAAFYNQFCAGRNDVEVKRTINVMKEMGYRGVILGYAKDVVVDASARREEAAGAGSKGTSGRAIDEWREGNLRTLTMIGSGDFLAIK